MRSSDWSSDVCSSDLHALVRSSEERDYRTWCLRNALFLNPLNDIAAHSIAAQDILTLPDLVSSIDEPPILIGFFNQMKQEYVSARWEYYLGIQAKRPPSSDRKVLLYNTLDYPSYGLAVARVRSEEHTSELKSLMRISYAVF